MNKQEIKVLNTETIKGNKIILQEVNNSIIQIYLTNKKNIFVLEFSFNKGLHAKAFEVYDQMKKDLKK